MFFFTKRFASKERMIKRYLNFEEIILSFFLIRYFFYRASWSSETSSMLRAFILGQDDTDKRNNKHSADFDHVISNQFTFLKEKKKKHLFLLSNSKLMNLIHQ